MLGRNRVYNWAGCRRLYLYQSLLQKFIRNLLWYLVPDWFACVIEKLRKRVLFFPVSNLTVSILKYYVLCGCSASGFSSSGFLYVTWYLKKKRAVKEGPHLWHSCGASHSLIMAFCMVTSFVGCPSSCQGSRTPCQLQISPLTTLGAVTADWDISVWQVTYIPIRVRTTKDGDPHGDLVEMLHGLLILPQSSILFARSWDRHRTSPSTGWEFALTGIRTRFSGWNMRRC